MEATTASRRLRCSIAYFVLAALIDVGVKRVSGLGAGGTGSYPEPPQGWHRQILFTASQQPRSAP